MASFIAVFAGPPILTAGITGGAFGVVDDVDELSENLSGLSLSPLATHGSILHLSLEPHHG